jgi:hypothetical protein
MAEVLDEQARMVIEKVGFITVMMPEGIRVTVADVINREFGLRKNEENLRRDTELYALQLEAQIREFGGTPVQRPFERPKTEQSPD